MNQFAGHTWHLIFYLEAAQCRDMSTQGYYMWNPYDILGQPQAKMVCVTVSKHAEKRPSVNKVGKRNPNENNIRSCHALSFKDDK